VDETVTVKFCASGDVGVHLLAATREWGVQAGNAKLGTAVAIAYSSIQVDHEAKEPREALT